MIVTSDALINSAMQGMSSHFSGAKMLLMSGVRPESGAATAEPVLATINLLPTVDGRTIQLEQVGDTLASLQGVATWGRIVDSSDDWVLDADVGNSPVNIQIDKTQFYAGSSVILQQFSIVGM